MHGRSDNEPRFTRGIQDPLVTMRRTARAGSEEEDATSLLRMKNVHSHRTRLGQARVASTTTCQSPSRITRSSNTQRARRVHIDDSQAGAYSPSNMTKARTCWSGPSLVAGTGFEPVTSGL